MKDMIWVAGFIHLRDIQIQNCKNVVLSHSSECCFIFSHCTDNPNISQKFDLNVILQRKMLYKL